jgi:trans-aconitate methyltransferase
MDLSPIQPKWYTDTLAFITPDFNNGVSYRTPPNCTFEIDDFESEWLYRRPFDFIHARELEGCIADDNRLFQRAFQHLAPGGYFELQSVYTRLVSDDDTAEKATNALLWMRNICEGAAKFGKPLDNVPQWKDKLRDAGFVDIEQELYKVCNSPHYATQFVPRCNPKH